MCPYLRSGNICNFYGTEALKDTLQTKCLPSSDNWKSCPNYTIRSPQERESKRVV